MKKYHLALVLLLAFTSCGTQSVPESTFNSEKIVSEVAYSTQASEIGKSFDFLMSSKEFSESQSLLSTQLWDPPPCDSHLVDAEHGYVSIQQSPGSRNIQWGFYMFVGQKYKYNSYTAYLYVDEVLKDDKINQIYEPHGSLQEYDPRTGGHQIHQGTIIRIRAYATGPQALTAIQLRCKSR